MEGICELEEIDGEEWVIFLEYRFNNVLSPEIIEFLSEYQKVKFGTDFNQPVTYQTDSSQNGKYPTLLPNSLTHLIFGHEFNQPVDNLPQSLTYLKFEWDFNQPVDNLPESLIYLSFGENFNQTVDNLPNSLTDLEFGYHFNHPVDNLPQSLTHLKFGNDFNQLLIICQIH